MVRKAVVILALAFATSASAQSANTQCRWIGSIWSCDTRGQGVTTPQPIDPGAVLRSGAALVPDYPESEPRQRAQPDSPTPFPPPTSLSGKYGIDADRRAFLDATLHYCRLGAPIANIPADQRAVAGAICYAYDQGRIAEIAGTKR